MWMNDHCGSRVAAHIGYERLEHEAGMPPYEHIDMVLKASGILRHWRKLRQQHAGKRLCGRNWTGFTRWRCSGTGSPFRRCNRQHDQGSRRRRCLGSSVDSVVWNLGKEVWMLIDPTRERLNGSSPATPSRRSGRRRLETMTAEAAHQCGSLHRFGAVRTYLRLRYFGRDSGQNRSRASSNSAPLPLRR